ncbi:MAG TPA: EamA family transporter [Firmicutes bacterium]|jgi:drug/metabolite transporter (DMT)-like permease|nr:EamA family transporter [Bacillota bacterium]
MSGKGIICKKKLGLYDFFQEKSYGLAVVGAVLIWSVSFVATKIAFRAFPPLTLGALRFIFAAVMLGVILWIQRGLIIPAPRDLFRLCLSGILGTTIYFSMENLGVQLATAADAALIVSSYPAITMLLEMFIYRATISWIRFVGAGLAILGVFLIIRESSNIGGTHRVIGDLILAATGIVWSFYNFVTRKVVNQYPIVLVTFYQTVAGAIAFLPLAWLEREKWQIPTTDSLGALFYLGVFCSVIAFLLYAYGLKRLASSTAVTLMNLVPVFGVIFAVIFLHEVMSVIQFAGGSIVIAGIGLSIRK